MEIFKTYLFFSGHDEGHPYLIDTIRHEGSLWLVGSWLESNDTGEKIPERIVRLSGLRFQEVENQPYQFLLNNALPKSVLDGQEQEGYVIAIHPDALNLKGPDSVH